jgi:hypothetical protein
VYLGRFLVVKKFKPNTSLTILAKDLRQIAEDIPDLSPIILRHMYYMRVTCNTHDCPSGYALSAQILGI